MASTGTMITVAPTGAELDKAAVPALPVTLDELVTTAIGCRQAGAAMIHVHIRDGDAAPTLDVGRLTDTVRALRESTDLIVQLSTGGAVTDPYERRLAVLAEQPIACLAPASPGPRRVVVGARRGVQGAHLLLPV